MVSFSRTLTEISNRPKPLGSSTLNSGITTPLLWEERLERLASGWRRGRWGCICPDPSCAEGLMLCLSHRTQVILGKVTPFVLTGQNMQKGGNLNASSSWRRKLSYSILSHLGITTHSESVRRNLLRFCKTATQSGSSLLPCQGTALLCPCSLPTQLPASPCPLHGLSHAQSRHVSLVWERKMASI